MRCIGKATGMPRWKARIHFMDFPLDLAFFLPPSFTSIFLAFILSDSLSLSVLISRSLSLCVSCLFNLKWEIVGYKNMSSISNVARCYSDAYPMRNGFVLHIRLTNLIIFSCESVVVGVVVISLFLCVRFFLLFSFRIFLIRNWIVSVFSIFDEKLRNTHRHTHKHTYTLTANKQAERWTFR